MRDWGAATVFISYCEQKKRNCFKPVSRLGKVLCFRDDLLSLSCQDADLRKRPFFNSYVMYYIEIGRLRSDRAWLLVRLARLKFAQDSKPKHVSNVIQIWLP